MVDRYGPGLCPGARRVWLGHFYFRQHADEDRNCGAADRHKAGAISLCGCDGDCLRDARLLFCDALVDQSSAIAHATRTPLMAAESRSHALTEPRWVRWSL